MFPCSISLCLDFRLKLYSKRGGKILNLINKDNELFVFYLYNTDLTLRVCVLIIGVKLFRYVPVRSNIPYLSLE